MEIDPQIAREGANDRTSATNTRETEHHHEVTLLSRTDAPQERWSKTPKTRGRQPRDQNAITVRYDCRNVDDLEQQLREYLATPNGPAEHTTIEFHFPISAAFMVYTADFKGKRNEPGSEKQNARLFGKLDRCAVSVIDALAQVGESKDQMRRQKSIAKVCVETCEKADGYRYSFHNNWLSREDEAYRFSYFCNDSTLNKGRAANEGAGTSGKKMRKPVYDCQGLIAVKFSQAKQSLEVHYKHIPVHQTYAERAPPPRKDSKRYKLLELFSPESLPQKRTRSRPSEEVGEPSKPLRKRRATEPGDGLHDRSSTDKTHQDRLQPLVHFLDSVDDHEDESPSRNATRRNEDVASSANDNEKPAGLSVARLSHSGSRRSVSGNFSDPLQEGNTNWEADKRNAVSVSRNKNTEPTRLQSIAEAARSASSNGPMSELEALKAKLEEAEQRIKRLESEKSSQPTYPQSWGPPNYSYPPPPPPPQHPWPYQQPSYSYPPGAVPPPPHPPHLSSNEASSPTTDTTKKKRGPKAKEPRALLPNAANGTRSFVPYVPQPVDDRPSYRPSSLRALGRAMKNAVTTEQPNTTEPDAIAAGAPTAPDRDMREGRQEDERREIESTDTMDNRTATQT